jgi:hypothetical protein
MVVVSWVLLMKILTIESIINVKNVFMLYWKSYLHIKNYIHEKFVCVALENLKIFIEECRDRIRQTIIEADTGLKSQPFWVGPNGWIHFFFLICVLSFLLLLNEFMPRTHGMSSFCLLYVFFPSLHREWDRPLSSKPIGLEAF